MAARKKTCRARFALILLFFVAPLAVKTQWTLHRSRDHYGGIRHSGPLSRVATVGNSFLRGLRSSKEGKEAARYCKTGDFTELYETIEQDLRPWKETGFTVSLMDWVLSGFTKYPLRR